VESKHKKFAITLISAVVLGLILVGSGVLTSLNAQAKRPAVHSKAGVFTVVAPGELYDEEVKVGHSNLVRKDDGIKLQVNTSDLIPGGVYTYWWLIDDGATSVMWAGYVIVKQNGKAHATLTLEKGPEAAAENPIAGSIWDEAFDLVKDGLTDPFNSEVEVHIFYHGLEDDWDGDPDWLFTFWVGDPDVCNINLGGPTLECPFAQITEHTP
jgi:hypothetical protein